MSPSRILIPTVLVIALAFFVFPPGNGGGAERTGTFDYPRTKSVDGSYALHGERIADPYRWLEDDEDPEVVAWDLAQEALLRARVAAYPDRARLAARLKAEFGGRSMRSLPTFRGGKRWFRLRPKGAEHAVLYATDEEAATDPIAVLDPNTWSADGTAGMAAWEVSDDGKLVAYRRDEKGSEETTLFVRDVATGKDLPDRITRTKFSSINWTRDSKGFFYERMPDPDSVPAGESQYHGRIYYHRLGTLVLDDPIVYGQDRPMLEGCWIFRSSDEKHWFVGRGLPWRNEEAYEAKFLNGRLETTPLITGFTERTEVDRVGDTYIFNTDRNTGNREVFTAPRTADGKVGAWKKVPFPAGKDGVIKGVTVVDDRLLVGHLKKNVVSRLYVTPLAGGSMREIELPGPGTVGRRIHTKRGDTRIWFRFQSHARPPTTYRCDLDTAALELVAEEVLPTTVDVDNLVSIQTTYESKDGTAVPIFLLHRKDVALDGSAPTILYGYGGFRVGMYPHFSRASAIWVEQGGVHAVACIRGGDELGEAWHKAGCLGNKQNVFDDFIAAADWLVNTGRATRAKLAIQGGSNGGLLTAVVVNQRPDLCRAAISSVPLTDMLRYHRFQFAKSWTMEYGDPDLEEQFRWIRPYSPYHNAAQDTAYPAVLLTAGLEDGRVNAFHARKMAAVWQRASVSGRPILLRIDRKGGHGAAGLSRYLEEQLDEWCFLLLELDGDA